MSIMRCLPVSMRAAWTDCKIPWEQVTEIRLRTGACCAVTYQTEGKTKRKPLPTVTLSEEDLRQTLSQLCAGSVHTYDEGLLRGYFSPLTLPGVRVGAAGRLLCTNRNPQRLQSLWSLCIRLPHTVRLRADVQDQLRAVLLGQAEQEIPPSPPVPDVPLASTLFYAPPGVGKTTLLRGVIETLCSCQNNHAPLCAAVLDHGEELCGEGFSDCTIDRFCGYPRGLAMEIATRAFAPQVMICDEIGSEEEAEEILRAQACGVPLIATAHADCLQSLLRRPCFRRLYEHGVFVRYVRLHRNSAGGGFLFQCEEAI